MIVLEKGLAVAVSVPVFDRKGKVIGILGGAQRTSFLATFIKENITDPEKSITLLDQEGNIIFSNAVPYQENITKYPDAQVLEKTLAGVTANMEIADAKEKGSISYVSIAPVRGIGWSVIVGQEKNAVLKQLYGYFVLSAVTGFVIFLLISVSLLYFRKEYKYRKTKELLQAEEALRGSEERVTKAFRSIPDALVISRLEDGKIFEVNDYWHKVFGYSREEVIGKSSLALNLFADSADRQRIVALLREQGFVRDLELQIRQKSGALRTATLSVESLEIHGDQYLLTVVQDITDHKWAEEGARALTG